MNTVEARSDTSRRTGSAIQPGHPIRVVIADESDIMLIGLKAVLNQVFNVTVISSCQTVVQLVNSLVSEQPHMLIMGERLQDEPNRVTLIERSRGLSRHVRIILIGSSSSALLIQDLLQRGVSAFLYRGDPIAENLMSAIQMIQQGRPYLSPTPSTDMAHALQTDGALSALDSEAHQVLWLLAQGYSVGWIAASLNLTPRHVYWVRAKLRQRFHATTNEHLIRRAAEEGFSV